MPQILTIDLWRHGPLATPGLLAGSSDLAADDAGVEQLAKAIVASRPQRILCSPLSRCLLPATRAAQALGVTAEQVAQLAEWHFGAWDGQRLDSPLLATALAGFWQDPASSQPPGGESLAAFRHRVDGWWSALAQDEASHWAVVTHGGVIRALLARVLELPDPAFGQSLRLSVNYGSRSRLTVSWWQGQRFNQIEQVNG